MIVLVRLKDPIGILMNHVVYVLRNTLIEVMVNVNIICGVAIIFVIIMKIVITALLIVPIRANHLDLFVVIQYVVLNWVKTVIIVYQIALIVLHNLKYVATDSVIMEKTVCHALKIVGLVLFHVVVILIVIYILMKIVYHVL
jgi:hypothetical protein